MKADFPNIGNSQYFFQCLEPQSLKSIAQGLLVDRLDLKKVSGFGDKKSAKYAALAIGLKTKRVV